MTDDDHDEAHRLWKERDGEAEPDNAPGTAQNKGATMVQMTMTLEQVQERFETFTEQARQRGAGLPEMRAEVALLLQRAGDAPVTAEEEPRKRYIVENLRWVLAKIDAGQIAPFATQKKEESAGV